MSPGWLYPARTAKTKNTRVGIYDMGEGWWSQGQMSRTAGITGVMKLHQPAADQGRRHGRLPARIRNDLWRGRSAVGRDVRSQPRFGRGADDGQAAHARRRGRGWECSLRLFLPHPRAVQIDASGHVISPEQQTPPLTIRPDGYLDVRVTGRDVRMRINLATSAHDGGSGYPRLRDSRPAPDRRCWRGSMSFWGQLNSAADLAGGRSGPTKADVPPLQGQPYPGADSIALARSSDVTYGSPAAAYAQPPYGGKIPSPNNRNQVLTHSTVWWMIPGDSPQAGGVSPNVSDNLMAGYLASRRSALAALGFDPHHMAIGDAPPNDWSVSGSYYPKEDQILSTGVYPSTTAHESMHRGIEMLRQAGMLPKEFGNLSEESSVRAQMLRNFGGVERGRGSVGDEQVDNGQYYNENRNFSPTMDALEAAAQQLYAKRHPGGPR